MSGLAVGHRGNLAGLLTPQAGESLVMALLDHLEPQVGFNPRGRVNAAAFDPTELAELGDSIREYGVLQPLIVRPRPRQPGRYWLIAGERRWRAALLNAQEDLVAGRAVQRPSLPVLVRDVNDQVALELAIVENAQRQDLDLVEESLVGLAYLSQMTSLNPEELKSYLSAIRKNPELDTHGIDTLLRRLYGTGVSVWSQQRIRVLDLNAAERQAVSAKTISFKVAVALSRLPSPQREEALKAAHEDGLTTSEIQAFMPLSPTKKPLAGETSELRRHLPKLASLSGRDAQRAKALIKELIQLLDLPGHQVS